MYVHQRKNISEFILSAKKLLLLANGKHKREAIRHLLKGKASKKWPVTSLKKHKNFTVIVDNKLFYL